MGGHEIMSKCKKADKSKSWWAAQETVNQAASLSMDVLEKAVANIGGAASFIGAMGKHQEALAKQNQEQYNAKIYWSGTSALDISTTSTSLDYMPKAGKKGGPSVVDYSDLFTEYDNSDHAPDEPVRTPPPQTMAELYKGSSFDPDSKHYHKPINPSPTGNQGASGIDVGAIETQLNTPTTLNKWLDIELAKETAIKATQYYTQYKWKGWEVTPQEYDKLSTECVGPFPTDSGIDYKEVHSSYTVPILTHNPTKSGIIKPTEEENE